MTTTILQILRDTKLTDGSLVRTSYLSDNTIELSVRKGDVTSCIRLPKTTEAAFELMQISYKFMNSCMMDDLERAVLQPTSNWETTEKDLLLPE